MQKQRLASLDILRGLDLFLLVFLQPILWDLLTRIGTPGAEQILWHFDHEVWSGFRFWDLIMPLFLFMSGISMPFAFSAYMRGDKPKSQAYKKVLRRFIILFILGMVVQGNLLYFNPEWILFYTNTLQAIAVGYLITALLYLNFSMRGQLVAMVILLACYAVPMMVCGDYSPEGNLAMRIDVAVFGDRRGDPTYAWLLPSLNFGVTVLLGALAGQIIRGGKVSGQVTVKLLAAGLALVLLGLAFSEVMPIVKRIWSTSMTLLSGGYCFILMAVFYQVVDVMQIHRPFDWLKIYGMNSIVAYMLGEVINFRSIVDSVSYGLKPCLEDYYTVWLTFGNFVILFLILRLIYRHNIFVKI